MITVKTADDASLALLKWVTPKRNIRRRLNKEQMLLAQNRRGWVTVVTLARQAPLGEAMNRYVQGYEVDTS